MHITSTPVKVSNGSKPLLITVVPNSIGRTLYYGFGDNTPDKWHSYIARVNDPLMIGTDFGPVWVKTGSKPVNIVVSSGL